MVPASGAPDGHAKRVANVVPKSKRFKARLTSVVLRSRAMLPWLKKTEMVFRATESMRKYDHSFGNVTVLQQVGLPRRASKVRENEDARLDDNHIQTGITRMAMYYTQRRRRFRREGFWRHADGVVCG